MNTLSLGAPFEIITPESAASAASSGDVRPSKGSVPGIGDLRQHPLHRHRHSCWF